MIRINLAPKKSGGTKSNTGLVEIIFYLLATAGVIAALIMMREDISPEIMKQQQELSKLQQNVAQFQDIMPEIQKLQEAQQRASQLKEIIERVQRINKNPVATLDELARIIPQKVWLTYFSEQDGQVVMKGIAGGTEEVAAFMLALQESPYFQEVRLANVSQVNEVLADLPSYRFVEFVITTKAVRLIGAAATATNP